MSLSISLSIYVYMYVFVRIYMYIYMYVYMYIYVCLSNSRWHSAKAVVIADVKNKIIVSLWHFFADMIFSGTSKFKTIKILIPKKICAQYLFQGILKTFLNIHALLFIFRKQ